MIYIYTLSNKFTISTTCISSYNYGIHRISFINICCRYNGMIHSLVIGIINNSKSTTFVINSASHRLIVNDMG